MLLDADVVIDLLREHPPAETWLAGISDLPHATFNTRHFLSVFGLTTTEPYAR